MWPKTTLNHTDTQTRLQRNQNMAPYARNIRSEEAHFFTWKVNPPKGSRFALAGLMIIVYDEYACAFANDRRTLLLCVRVVLYGT